MEKTMIAALRKCKANSVHLSGNTVYCIDYGNSSCHGALTMQNEESIEPGAYDKKGVLGGVYEKSGDYCPPEENQGAILTYDDGDFLREFAPVFSRLAPYAADDETRYFINGVYLENEFMTATDGRRLASWKLKNSIELPEGEKGFILKPTNCLLYLLEKFTLARIAIEKRGKKSDTYAVFYFIEYGTVYALKTIDGLFPVWQRVMPEIRESDDTLKIPSADTLKKTVLSCKVKKERPFIVVETVQGNQVRINPLYLLDAIKEIQEMSGASPSKAWRGDIGSLSVVIMPMVID